MNTQLKTILELLAKKYPTNYGEGMNPVLVIYDDESGRIIKDVQRDIYDGSNLLFGFNDIEELVTHLKEKNKK